MIQRFCELTSGAGGQPPAPDRRSETLRFLLAGALLLVLLVGQSALAAAEPTKWVVAGRSSTDLGNALADAGVAVRSPSLRVAAITLRPHQHAALVADPRIEALEPDAPVVLEGTQSPAPWSLDRIDQRQLPLSDTYTWEDDGSGVDVYVVDTGVRATHEELTGRVAPGHSVLPGGTDDCHGHGTWVAGLVAGDTYGVSKSARIVPVRTFDCDGTATISDIISAIDWIASNHTPGDPGAVNLSLSTTTSEVLEAAVRELTSTGITVVAAAGNQAGDACVRSPARMQEVITVAGFDRDDRLWPTSNSGSCVDVFAPGGGMISAGHGSDDETAGMSGTSGAAALASGAAARILSRPGWSSAGGASVDDVVRREATASVPAGALAGSPEALLFAPMTIPEPPPGRRSGVALPGSTALGGDPGASSGCARIAGEGELRLPIDVPHGVVLERVEAVGRNGPGLLRLRSHGWADAGPETRTLVGLPTGSTLARSAASWTMQRHDDLVAYWSPDAPSSAELCAVRIVYRAAPIADDVRTFRTRQPCVVLDTRGEPTGAPPRTVEVTQPCGLVADTLGVVAHVVAFAGEGPVRLGPSTGSLDRTLVGEGEEGLVDSVLTLPLHDGSIAVDAPGRAVRIVVTSELTRFPDVVAPDWADPA